MAIENFTTWTEVDPNSRLTQTSTRSTHAALARNEDAYLYTDKGAGHFAGDFTHLVTVFIDSGAASLGLAGFWSLGNAVDDWAQLLTDGPLLVFYKDSGATSRFTLRAKTAGGADNFDKSAGTANATIYYCEIERDESIGTFGQLDVRMYSDSGRTTLVDTLTVSLGSQDDYRYAFVSHSFNSGATADTTGYSENLDFQEAGGEEPATRRYSLTLVGVG